MNENENTEITDDNKVEETGRTEPKNLFKFKITDILDGSILTKHYFINQLPYIFMLTVLAVVYIGNRNHAESIIRDIIAIQKEVKDLKSESITIASELMMISKQTEVSKQVQDRGIDIKEATEPPKKLHIKKETD